MLVEQSKSIYISFIDSEQRFREKIHLKLIKNWQKNFVLSCYQSCLQHQFALRAFFSYYNQLTSVTTFIPTKYRHMQPNAVVGTAFGCVRVCLWEIVYNICELVTSCYQFHNKKQLLFCWSQIWHQIGSFTERCHTERHVMVKSAKMKNDYTAKQNVSQCSLFMLIPNLTPDFMCDAPLSHRKWCHCKVSKHKTSLYCKIKSLPVSIFCADSKIDIEFEFRLYAVTQEVMSSESQQN